MDIVLITLGVICLIIGLLGCVAPMLPGPPISYAALLLLHFTEKVQFSNTQLFGWLVVVVIVQLLDYIVPILGVKRFGGSRWGNWGCFIGTLIGICVFPPWGIIVGPFVGAFVGEMLGGKKSNDALKAGYGAFLGFLFGTVIKLIVCGMFTYYFAVALLSK